MKAAPTLEEEAAEFLNVMTIDERFHGRVKIFPPLQCLYAMRAAYWIRINASSIMTVEERVPLESTSSCALDHPPFEEMYESYRRLLAADRSSDKVALGSALREMKIVEFCSTSNGQLERMERLTEQNETHVRLILHVELALFALELEDQAAARSHTQEAWVLDPTGWERYILCTLQGLFAACSGRVQEAIHWLEDSTSACFEDEVILMECGVRPPNLGLAQKLLSLGQRIPVVDYLLACQDVWRSKGMPFGEWIHQLELGQEPDLEACETIRELSRPFHRLDLQSRRAFKPVAARSSGAPPNTRRSRKEVLLAREKRLEESKRIMEMIQRERTSGGTPPTASGEG